MTKVPGVNYDVLINALQRDGWVVVRQRGSHIRMQKHTSAETLITDHPCTQTNKALHPLTHIKAGQDDG